MLTNYIIFASISITYAPVCETTKHYEHNPLHMYKPGETRKHWKPSGADFGDLSLEWYSSICDKDKPPSFWILATEFRF